MPVNQVSMTSPAAVDQAAIQRRMAMAEALQADSVRPVEASSFQGIQAPISWTQGLAKMLQAYGARKGIEKADADEKALVGQQQARRGQDMQALIKALGGTPASQEQIVDEQANNGEGALATINAPAVAPRESLMATLPTLQDPAVQQMGMGLIQQQIANEMKPASYQDLGDRFAVIKNGQIIGYMPKGATPDAQLREQGQDRRHLTPSGSVVLQEQGQQQRHLTPSGSAVLSSDTTRRGQDLTATTTRRGQDMTDATARAAQAQAADADLQGRLAESRAAGQERGQAQAQAQITLPAAEQKVNQTVSLLNQMIGTAGRDLKPGEQPVAPHPGFKGTIGAGYGMRFVPGTSESDFQAMLDQVRGSAFLQAFESLKGGGAITEIEGRKAEQAITRMRESQSESEFIKAAREFETNITKGMELARKRAGAKPIVVDW